MHALTVFFGLSLVIANVFPLPNILEDDIPNVEPEYLDMLLENERYEEFSKLMGIENVDLVKPREHVEPEYLDMLLENERYEEFSKLMGIENVDLVKPRERERNEHPMYHKELRHMDILPPRKNKKTNDEGERQAMRFEIQPSSKWLGGYVPYGISSKYTHKQRQIILDAIDNWNTQVKCIKFKPRTNEKNYVYYFSGKGCFSDLGRVGGQQPISIQTNSCLSQGTINHEMEHAIGIDHEMSRLDRDNYVKMLWDNILDEWEYQFEQIDPDTMKDILDYDYYSLMHYEIASPDNEDYPAFEILEDGIDASRVGTADDFTEMDIKKINALYC